MVKISPSDFPSTPSLPPSARPMLLLCLVIAVCCYTIRKLKLQRGRVMMGRQTAPRHRHSRLDSARHTDHQIWPGKQVESVAINRYDTLTLWPILQNCWRCGETEGAYSTPPLSPLTIARYIIYQYATAGAAVVHRTRQTIISEPATTEQQSSTTSQSHSQKCTYSKCILSRIDLKVASF